MHALLHDAFGIFHRLTNKSNGYYYRSCRENIPNWMKQSTLIGHLTGLTFCLSYLINHKFIEEIVTYSLKSLILISLLISYGYEW